jgi:hypothetical protein
MGLCFQPGDRPDCLFGANLLTDGAAGAHRGIDNGLFAGGLNGGAADQQADAALVAFLVSIIWVSPCLGTCTTQAPRTITTESSLGIQGGFNGRPDFFDIERIDDGEIFHADAFDDIFQHDFAAGLALHGNTGAGVFLVAGHGGGAVIGDDNRDFALIVNGIHQRGDAGM